MESDPEPSPRTKGEMWRKQILESIAQHIRSKNTYPTVQDIKEISRIRSFNTLTRHLETLKKEGVIEWDNSSIRLKDVQAD